MAMTERMMEICEAERKAWTRGNVASGRKALLGKSPRCREHFKSQNESFQLLSLL
jgi:hypothetical protein